MAHMAPNMETVAFKSLKARHTKGFHMAPHGTIWRSRAIQHAIRKVLKLRMARVKPSILNNGAMCAICAIQMRHQSR